MTDYGRIFIGGEWVASSSAATVPVLNPATEEISTEVPAGSAADADRAVAAARAAFGVWSPTPPRERGKYLTRMGEAVEARADEIAAMVSADVGTPRKLSMSAHVRSALATFAIYAELADTYPWEESLGSSTVVRAPVGVVAAITPWNFPVGLAVDKISPALLAGCPVVWKPSEVAPLSAWILAEAAAEADLPPGVFNMLSGDGPTVGEALVANPDVDMISFTGSTRAGKRILSLAAERVARVVLEMGGKSANIILDDLDDAELDRALRSSVQSCYLNSGQVCVAPTRLLVPRDRYADAVARVAAIAEATTVGDPASDVQLGPVVSATQLARVRGYIERGVEEGARLVTGGAKPPEGLAKGYYVRPTVFADVDSSMTIAQEEIFGPVLSIIAYDDEADAIRIANDSTYGLAGGVFSADTARAGRVARQLRTGTVRINGSTFTREVPIGGFKQSGLGRAKGRFGLDEYVEIQAISQPA